MQLSGVKNTKPKEIGNNFIKASRKGSSRRNQTKSTQKKSNKDNNPNITKKTNKSRYKAYKKRNKYKSNRQLSYFTITKNITEDSQYESESETSENSQDEILQQQLNDILKCNNDKYSIQEIECTKEVSHYFINEMFNPDPKFFKDSVEIQKIIDKIQVKAPWKITKYAEAYVNPVIASPTNGKQPIIRLLMLIDSGGSLNLISKKLVNILKLPCKASYQEFSTIAGKVKASQNTLISLCCKLKDRPRENDSE